MLYLSIFIINLIGSYYIEHIEAGSSKKVKLMGEWPYNVVLLLGVVFIIIGESINKMFFMFILSVIATVIFYLNEIFKINAKKNK